MELRVLIAPSSFDVSIYFTGNVVYVLRNGHDIAVHQIKPRVAVETTNRNFWIPQLLPAPNDTHGRGN